MNYIENYNQWLESDYIDEETKNELLQIANDDKEIEDRFYKELEFGTAGLRGIIGAGTNRMNKYNIRKVTQGLANYICMQGEEAMERGVAIAYDSRHKSNEFANEAAFVLNANGIKTYVFETLKPTPVLSYAVRSFKCISGIVVTASHNPSNYNGYKVYWEDGAQIVYPHDEKIIEEVRNIESLEQVKRENEKTELYNSIDDEFDTSYLEVVKSQSIRPEVLSEYGEDIKVVYTPFNGTGAAFVPRLLKEMGVKDIYTVKEQFKPDPDFTTTKYPNPEETKNFELAIKLAEKKDADIIMGTDPDADRFACLVKNSGGEYVSLTGNQVGALFTEYVLSGLEEKEELSSKAYVIKSIVTSEMIRTICAEHDVLLVDVYTGFKHIGEAIRKFEETGVNKYIFGFEESIGYLLGDYARDKDGMVASMLMTEILAYAKSQDKNILDLFEDMYQKYGYYKEFTKSFIFKGIEGEQKIKDIMENLRNDLPTSFGEFKVIETRDYKFGTATTIAGEERKLNFRPSNVLYFELENNAWFAIRPSGTEPKVKLYFGVKGKTNVEAKDLMSNLYDKVTKEINIEE